MIAFAIIPRYTAKTRMAAVTAALGGPFVDGAVDVRVRPDVFRAEAPRLGYDPSRPLPSALAIASHVKPLGDGRVCVVASPNGPCVFDFDDEDGVWRLAGYEGPLDGSAARARGTN